MLDVAQRIAATRLAPALETANQQTYLQALKTMARAAGAPEPRALTDADALAGIKARAAVSARSIVGVRATRMAALVQQHGSRATAEPAFRQWERGQGDLVSGYEARMTAAQAASDFISRNGITGTEHVEPTSTAGLDDSCDDAINLGEQPVGTIDPPPYHPRCPHGLVYSLDAPAPGTTIWTGDN